jgi:hypothetical protein
VKTRRRPTSVAHGGSAQLLRCGGELSRRQHSQTGHPVEVGSVPRCESEAVGQGGGGDPEVVRADWPATSAEIGPDFGMNAGNGLGKSDTQELGFSMISTR